MIYSIERMRGTRTLDGSPVYAVIQDMAGVPRLGLCITTYNPAVEIVNQCVKPGDAVIEKDTTISISSYEAWMQIERRCQRFLNGD